MNKINWAASFVLFCLFVQMVGALKLIRLYSHKVLEQIYLLPLRLESMSAYKLWWKGRARSRLGSAPRPWWPGCWPRPWSCCRWCRWRRWCRWAPPWTRRAWWPSGCSGTRRRFRGLWRRRWRCRTAHCRRSSPWLENTGSKSLRGILATYLLEKIKRNYRAAYKFMSITKTKRSKVAQAIFKSNVEKFPN